MSSEAASITLSQLFSQFYRPRRLLGRSQSNDLQYEIQIRHLRRYLGRDPTIVDLEEDTLCRFLDWLHDSGKRSAETVNKARAHLCALWRFAAERRMVEHWPTVAPMPVPERQPVAWTMEEIRAILKAAEKMSGEFGRVPEGAYWTAFYRVLWAGGERTGAMLKLEWSWINWRAKSLSVPGDARKGRKSMTYWFDEPTIEALKAIRKPPRVLIFECPVNKTTFYNHHKRLLKLAGLPVGRKCGPQKLRRSFASYLEREGGNATQALKHSERSVTVNSYLDPTILGRPKHCDLVPKL